MCTNPLKGFKYGKTKNGKDNYIITSYQIDHLEIDSNGRILKVVDSDSNYNYKPIRDWLEIPCGKCLECRLDYSRQWANRCMCEAQQYEHNCFITLTYDEENIRKNTTTYAKRSSGDVLEANTLVKKDFQLFIKRLRRQLEPNQIRFFGCGEYGSKSQRPHYHAIIFNWFPDEDDLKLVGANSITGDKYYSSDLLTNVWPYGHNVVAACTWETCAYVSRYVAKKLNQVDSDIYDKLNIEPEFVLMSRRPGIGAAWFHSHSNDYADFLENYFSTENGSKKLTPNRYFDKLLDKVDSDKLQKNKEIRKEFAEQRKKLEKGNTSLPYLEYLEVKENAIKNKTKSLVRKEL